MEIVITDGFTLNPGDLDWKGFETIGKVRYYDRTLPVEVIAKCFNAEVIVTNKTIINADLMDAATHLKMIAVTATGFNNVDVLTAKSRGIVVCNVPGYGTYSVAQHTFSLLLHLTNHVAMNIDSVQQGLWFTAKDWCYSLQPIVELKDKVIGIIGMGKIGRQVALMAHAFGMNVIYYGGQAELPLAKKVSLYQLFIQSDVVSLHCPLTNENPGFVNKEMLGLMKPTSILINTARGALINEKDLVQALYQKRIAAAALDVLSEEPPKGDHPLIGLPNCIITPHNAWMSVEARKRIMHITLENIRAYVDGYPKNVVNG